MEVIFTISGQADESNHLRSILASADAQHTERAREADGSVTYSITVPNEKGEKLKSTLVKYAREIS